MSSTENIPADSMKREFYNKESKNIQLDFIDSFFHHYVTFNQCSDHSCLIKYLGNHTNETIQIPVIFFECLALKNEEYF